MEDKNCLSYWFPKLRVAGLPVPRTEMVRTDCDLSPLLDGKTPGRHDVFLALLRAACRRVWSPEGVFLRTGQGSGKHNWSQTCFVRDLAQLPSHVAALVEWSACVDFLGLPTHVWAAREMLPTLPVMHAPNYEGMPVCREFRCFVRGAEVLCEHPYWPAKALEQGFPVRRESLPPGGVWGAQPLPRELPDGFGEAYSALCALSPAEEAEVRALASRAGAALGGEWSVDVLWTERGWFVCDVAEAARSYHWPECPKAGLFS